MKSQSEGVFSRAIKKTKNYPQRSFLRDDRQRNI